MLNQNFIILGAILTFFGGLNYIIYTLKGKTKPNKVTWFLWTINPIIIFAAEIKQGVGLQSLLAITNGITPFLIFVSSFINKKSQWKLNKFDLLCGGLSLIGLLLWMLTKIGNIAIILSICADFLAALPTIRKAYHSPETESYFAYFTGFLGAALTILTIKQWDFAVSGFAIYIALCNLLITVLIKFKLGKKISYSFSA